MEVIEAPKRPRTPVSDMEVLRVSDMEVLRVLEDMGFLWRLGERICRAVMQRHNNNLEQVVAELALYTARREE